MAGPLPFRRSGLVPQFLTAKRFGGPSKRFADPLDPLGCRFLRTDPRETVVVEKFEAMVRLGIATPG